MMYFDSHAHYYDERFSWESEKTIDEILGGLLSNDVSFIVNVGTSPETSRLAIEQAKRYENMYTAIGIHPSDTRFLVDMDKELCDIEQMILDKSNKCVCLGEIGLDYHYDDTDREKQMSYFLAQMEMANRLNLPVCIHDREAHGDVMDVIRKFPNVRGILHSFSGSSQMASELLKLGYMISFSGTITFKNARKTRETALVVPQNMALIETDCPYLSPEPFRGKLNHSGNLKYTNAALAGIWGISEEECAKITEENAKRIFRIS